MVSRVTLDLAPRVRANLRTRTDPSEVASYTHRLRGLLDDEPIRAHTGTLDRYQRLTGSALSATPGDILDSLDRTDLNLKYYENGKVTIPAAVNPASKYNNKMWTRDTALIALMLDELGHTDLAVEIAESLAMTYAREEERERLINFVLNDPDPAYKFQTDVESIPHIMFSIPPGEIHGYNKWGHNQLDAFGMLTLLFFKFAREGKLDLRKLEEKLIEINPKNAIESPFPLFEQLKNRIGYWRVRDVGPWEDEPGGPEEGRLSSVSLCLAGSNEAFDCLDQMHIPNLDLFKQRLAQNREYGEHTLHQRLPENGSYVRETDRHESDAALIFVLLFGPKLNKEQKDIILKKIYEQRMTDFGITRRHRDNYMGSNFIHNPYGQGKFSDVDSYDHKLAEWVPFDAWLAVYHSKEYCANPTINEENLSLAIMHYERFMKMVPVKDFNYMNRFKEANHDNGQREVFIPKGTIGEAYFWDGGERKLNENSPLQMGVVAAAWMDQELGKALQIKIEQDKSPVIIKGRKFQIAY